MFKKILVAGLVVGTVAYALRDKIAEGFAYVEERFLTWAAEDGTEDEPDTVFRGTAPVDPDRYPVGKRHDEE
jgi:hypothetical protein